MRNIDLNNLTLNGQENKEGICRNLFMIFIEWLTVKYTEHGKGGKDT